MKTITPSLKQIASGLRFPEGPVAMPRRLGGAGRDRAADALARHARRQGARDRHAGRRAQRRGDGPGRQDLRDQQRRPQVHGAAGQALPDRAGRRLQGRQHPDRGSRDGKFETLYDSCDGRRAPRAQRPRLRQRRRLLVHRPRQDARPRRGPRRGLLREGRRLADPGGDLPARAAERHRALTGRADALRGRDADRALLGVPALRRPARSSRRTGRTAARRARSSSGSAATRCSTRSPSTPRATSASPR